MTAHETAKLAIHFHPRQQLAFQSVATEILFGGAAGPGKSHLLRIAAITWCAEIPGLQVYLFRRIREDLIRNHIEGPKGFRSLLAPWTVAGFAKIVGDDEIRFWNGSKIHLCHVKDEGDRFQYQGAEIHVLLIDELTHFTEVIYRFLRSRSRAVGLDLPAKYKNKFPCIICGSNPGNIGHEWVKRFWLDNALDLQIRLMPEEEGGMLRQFISGRLEDNPSLIEDDPNYERKLAGLGSPELVRAMRFGDWDVIEGAFFPEFQRHLHVVRPFFIPHHWTRFVSADWGSAVPFSIGWWAIVPDAFDGDLERIGGQRLAAGMEFRNELPRGALIRYKEWYGSPDHSNKGLKLTAEEVAAGICDRERNEPQLDGRPRITYRVIDPAAFKQDGGPSIAERLANPPYRLFFRPADNSRIGRRGAMGGWDQVRQRLKGSFGTPSIYFFETCVDTLRTLPLAQHDPARPEDLLLQEDHALDEIRYACLSRPYSIEQEFAEPRKFPAQALGDGQIIIHDVEDLADLSDTRRKVARYQRIA